MWQKKVERWWWWAERSSTRKQAKAREESRKAVLGDAGYYRGEAMKSGMMAEEVRTAK